MAVAADVLQGTDSTAGAGRIREAFAGAHGDGRVALLAYVLAGYPDAETSLQAAIATIDAGADVLEVGLPYSDPLADGATLQRASGAALRNGATFARSIELLAAIHAVRPAVPLVPMAYVNQAIGAGDATAALRSLADAGASALILPDLTPDEGAPVEAAARETGIALVYLITPTTPRERRRAIAGRSGGFVYGVSLVGVTGARRSLPAEVGRFVRETKAVSRVPVAVGFGVSRAEHVRRLTRAGADGVVAASALVDALGPDGSDLRAMTALVRVLRAATARVGEAS